MVINFWSKYLLEKNQNKQKLLETLLKVFTLLYFNIGIKTQILGPGGGARYKVPALT